MPDHVHLLAEGTTPEFDLERFASSFKQKSGFTFSRARSARLWQDGYRDRILRSDEATLTGEAQRIVRGAFRKGHAA